MKSLETVKEICDRLEDVIVPYALLDSLECAVNDIQRWRSMGDDIPKHTQEDLEYSERYAEALAIVIDAWTVENSNDRMRVENLMSCIRK